MKHTQENVNQFFLKNRRVMKTTDAFNQMSSPQRGLAYQKVLIQKAELLEALLSYMDHCQVLMEGAYVTKESSQFKMLALLKIKGQDAIKTAES